MPLALLSSISATSGRRIGAGPIHHTPQAGRFRYTPLAGAPGTTTATTATTSSPELITTQLLQMAAATGRNLNQILPCICILDTHEKFPEFVEKYEQKRDFFLF